MYGETNIALSADVQGRGLSPHVRGNLPYSLNGPPALGSIPACTGKPRRKVQAPKRRRVYPRMYGETADRRRRRNHGRGLSPHVRGNHESGARVLRTGGSIPACTGKPPPGSAATMPLWVYPRMYGETNFLALAYCHNAGLSPHVRGNRWHARGMVVYPGSIPACTGKPSPAFRFPSRWRVYPRMYGETAPAATPPIDDSGLSPHVRGNHHPTHSEWHAAGSIPACTGKPEGGNE